MIEWTPEKGWGMDTFDLELTSTPESARLAAENMREIMKSTAIIESLEAIPKPAPFDPECTKCESCGTSVFVLTVNSPKEDLAGTRWMERPYLTDPFSAAMTEHTKARCKSMREQAGG